jgi:hypothetical protein
MLLYIHKVGMYAGLDNSPREALHLAIDKAR